MEEENTEGEAKGEGEASHKDERGKADALGRDEEPAMRRWPCDWPVWTGVGRREKGRTRENDGEKKTEKENPGVEPTHVFCFALLVPGTELWLKVVQASWTRPSTHQARQKETLRPPPLAPSAPSKCRTATLGGVEPTRPAPGLCQSQLDWGTGDGGRGKAWCIGVHRDHWERWRTRAFVVGRAVLPDYLLGRAEEEAEVERRKTQREGQCVREEGNESVGEKEWWLYLSRCTASFTNF